MAKFEITVTETYSCIVEVPDEITEDQVEDHFISNEDISQWNRTFQTSNTDVSKAIGNPEPRRIIPADDFNS